MIIDFKINVAVKIILSVDNKINYGAAIGKKANVTYASVMKNIHSLKQISILEINKNGRESIITLTDKGKELKVHLEAIKRRC